MRAAMAMCRRPSLRAATVSFLLVTAITGCAPGDARTCGSDGAGENPDVVADTFSTGEYVGAVRGEGAAAFLYEPDAAKRLFDGEAIYVLCVGDEVMTAGSTQTAPLLSDAPAAAGLRVGALAGRTNHAVEIEPGWILGRVDDERIVTLHLTWPGDDHDESGAGGEWSTPLGMGLFLVHLAPAVPQEARLHLRFLDARGELVWSQAAGG